jgi:glycosyltransferase involved in cell wall biosynthesis
MKLSIIIPVYNEQGTIAEIIQKVEATDFEKEIIIVDDGSSDGTEKYLSSIRGRKENIKIFFHKTNSGKGAAIRTGLGYAGGDVVIVQDADLECDPKDYPVLLKPFQEKNAPVVYGSRCLGNNPRGRMIYFLGGKILTFFCNLLYGTSLTDVSACYKAFKLEIIKNINLKSNRFEFCVEVTAKLAKAGYKIIEVPISYYPRPDNIGKKLKIKDGFSAAWTLLKCYFVD